MSTYPLLTTILASCVQISKKASKILHEVKLSHGIDITDNDYANTAIEMSQMCIKKSLNLLFPKLKLCFEENLQSSVVDDYDDIEKGVDENVLEIGKHLYEIMPTYENIKAKDLYVWIDPLNGIEEYTTDNRIHEVTILIGIAWNGTPIAGVINQPFYNGDTEDLSSVRFMWGICGLGAFNHVDGKIIEVEDRLNRLYNSTENRIITSKLFSNNLLKNMYDLIMIKNFEIIPAGQCGFNVLCILDGLVDCFVFPAPGIKRWETCAPEAILYAIGGRLKSVYGDNYTYSSKYLNKNNFGVLASIFNHDLYIKSLNQNVLTQLMNKSEVK